MSKNVLIITGYTDLTIPTDDNTMKEVFDLTLPSKQRYANKHGYDLLSMRSFGTDKDNKFKKNDIGFLRADIAFKMIQYYDIVMWIDADSVITNDKYSISDFYLDEDHCFYASWDWNGKNSFSTGNFIVTNTKNTQTFISFYNQVCMKFPHEQDTLNALYINSPFRNIIKILDHKFLGAVPHIDMYGKELWKDRMPIPYPWNSDCFLSHLTGISNKDRIRILNDFYKDYL